MGCEQLMKRKKVLDLFSGCGGLSLGFEQAGYEIILGIDHWDVALNTFQKNHPESKIACLDMSNTHPKGVSETYDINTIDIIIGGPPCQGFSISGKRNLNDPRNKLYQSFVNFVEFYKPKAFVMENVPNLVYMHEGKIRETIIQEFQDLGYKVSFKILLASDYGVPQNRKRVFFVGLKNGKEFKFPEGQFKDNHITSREAIDDLPAGELTDGEKYLSDASSEYQKIMRTDSDKIYNHQLTKHTDKTKEIIALVPDGGNYKDLPEGLRNTRNVNIAWTRLNSNRPSFTIDTGHNHHFHYKYNRVPTVRESARIQSFPDNFIFTGTKNEQLKQVGNAVPPMLSKSIALELLHYL